MELTNTSKITPSPNVVYQEVSGETVLLNLQSERYFGLDAVGTRVWEFIQEKLTVEGIVDRIYEEYAENKAKISTDVVDLIKSLETSGLIQLNA